ncbi:MAG: hypothetical protein DLM59_01920 [Pseudonocardiales bacterium]|nr:MAG: hypothetical protein DLM59_01920 [Pseudonocardiales bacterium]
MTNSTAGRWPLAVLLAVTLTAAAACSARAQSVAKQRPGPSASSAPASDGVTASPGAGTQRPAPVESNPPGDIPDNIAYVTYRNAAGRYSFLHPEGWAEQAAAVNVTFTDKLNGIIATSMAATAAPTLGGAQQEVARLRSSQPAFEFRSAKAIKLPGGSGVLIVFRRNSAPDPVTGRVFRDEVQRYEVYSAGHAVVLDLFGAVGSDNVDPYTKISQSLRLA